MESTTVLAALTWIGTGCWALCFWWMHRISERQDALLHELGEQTARIERLSREEHKLIKKVHPAVSEIKDSMKVVAESVAESSPGAPAMPGASPSESPLPRSRSARAPG
jgi:hypothetical protein